MDARGFSRGRSSVNAGSFVQPLMVLRLARTRVSTLNPYLIHAR